MHVFVEGEGNERKMSYYCQKEFTKIMHVVTILSIKIFTLREVFNRLRQ